MIAPYRPLTAAERRRGVAAVAACRRVLAANRPKGDR